MFHEVLRGCAEAQQYICIRNHTATVNGCTICVSYAHEKKQRTVQREERTVTKWTDLYDEIEEQRISISFSFNWSFVYLFNIYKKRKKIWF